MSRIGNKAITVPAGVEITIGAGNGDQCGRRYRYS